MHRQNTKNSSQKSDCIQIIFLSFVALTIILLNMLAKINFPVNGSPLMIEST